MLHLCRLWFSKVLIGLYLAHWLFLEQGGTCWQCGTHKWYAIRIRLGTTDVNEPCIHVSNAEWPPHFADFIPFQYFYYIPFVWSFVHGCHMHVSCKETGFPGKNFEDWFFRQEHTAIILWSMLNTAFLSAEYVKLHEAFSSVFHKMFVWLL